MFFLPLSRLAIGGLLTPCIEFVVCDIYILVPAMFILACSFVTVSNSIEFFHLDLATTGTSLLQNIRQHLNIKNGCMRQTLSLLARL
jgi:hypothetical protein